MTSVAPAPAEKKGPSRSNSGNSVANTSASTKQQQQQSQQQQSELDPVLQQISSKSSILIAPLTLTLYIPSVHVGAVIGRRGQTINQLHKSAPNVRVSVVGPEHANAATSQLPYTYTKLDWSYPDWTPVVIRALNNSGDASVAVFQIAHKLAHMVDDKLDEVVLDVPISRTKHAALVGKRGQCLATLSADTNVRIYVPSKTLRHDMIQLEGELDNVQVCLPKILAIAFKTKQKSTPDVESETIVLPQAPSQTKLRSVGRKTECSIKKKKLFGTPAQWQLCIMGETKEQVQQAASLLRKSKWNEETVATATPTTTPSTSEAATPPVPSSSPRRNPRGGPGRGRSNNKSTPKRGGGGSNTKQPKSPGAADDKASATAPASL